MKRVVSSVSPWTGKTIANHTLMNKTEALEAVNGAAKLFRGSKFELDDRVNMAKRLASGLRDKADGLAALASAEMGKPSEQSKHEVLKCADLAEYYSESGPGFLRDEPLGGDTSFPLHTTASGRIPGFNCSTVYRPLGVILGIMPWNFPVWQVIRWAVPTIMAGNACVLKHASNVQGTAKMLEDIMRDSGYQGWFTNLAIQSDDVEDLIAQSDIAGVAFTGSERAGRAVAEASGRNLKKCVVELGGSDACIIAEGASNMKSIARQVVKGRMHNTGQSCISPKRVIVTRKHLRAFEEAVASEIQNLEFGLDFGPVVSEQAALEIEKQVDKGISDGARILARWTGSRASHPVVSPIALADVSRQNHLTQEEVFGPVLVIVPAENDAEAIELANASPFGLGASIFTEDHEKGIMIAKDQLDAGMTFVNALPRSDPRMPFGGIKKSGFGRECGAWGIREFCNVKSIWIRQ